MLNEGPGVPYTSRIELRMLARRYGLKVNELMSLYLNYFEFIKPLVDEGVPPSAPCWRGYPRGT